MKSIGKGNYFIQPFATHKFQSYSYTYLSASNVPQISLDLATLPPQIANSWVFYSASAPYNPDGIYTQPLYASVNHLFYSSQSFWNTQNSTLQKGWMPTGSNIYVLNIAQQAYGEGIQPGTFELTTAGGTGSIVDDGQGGLYGGSTGSGQIGNIFYTTGVVILQQDISSYSSSLISQNGIYATTASQFSIEFNATQTINEHTAFCTIQIGEMNYTINPSIASTSSLVSGSIPVKTADSFLSGTLTPYMTTIGLYNTENQLMAIGKFPRPLKRAPDSTQTIIVKFDLY